MSICILNHGIKVLFLGVAIKANRRAQTEGMAQEHGQQAKLETI